MTYCTYITIYSGNLLPPFYIGSSSVKRIHDGYRGSVSSKKYSKIWKKELKDNPHLFKTTIFTLHLSRKEATLRERDLQFKLRVVCNPLYINEAYASHGSFVDMDQSGKNNPMYGKTHSDYTRLLMSRSGEGKHSQPKTEAFKKHMSEIYIGKSYEERFGKDRADQIKANQSLPKSSEHIQKIKDNPYNADRPKYPCPHCGAMCSIGNLKRWHGDNCKSLKVITNP